MELMRNVTFLSREFGFTYQEILQLPFAIYLSYLRWGKQWKMEENPEFMEKVEQHKLLKQTEPELDKLRGLKL